MLRVYLERTKFTKNMVRFDEMEDAENQVLRAVYLRKQEYRQLGDPEVLCITVENAEGQAAAKSA